MSIALEYKVQLLEKLLEAQDRRIEALERAHVKAGDRLLGVNAIRRENGAKLRQAIQRIVSEQPDLSSKQVLKALAITDIGGTSLPSVRTVQWHIKAVRNTAALRMRSDVPA